MRMGRVEGLRHGFFGRRRIGCAVGVDHRAGRLVRANECGVHDVTPCENHFRQPYHVPKPPRRAPALGYNAQIPNTGLPRSMELSITTLALLVLTPLLVWRIYTRIKSRMTRQRSIVSRHYTGVLVFGALILVPAAQLLDNFTNLAALLGGAAAGIGYGVWGLKLTRFEANQQGYWYTPNARLGLVMAMIFVARILYIGVEVYANQGKGVATPRLTESLLTMLCVGVSCGYFACYSAGLLRWRRQMRKQIDAV